MVNLFRLALATFRLARMIATEEGPAQVFLHLRAAAGAFDYNAQGQPMTSLGRGISCPYCVGVYAALLLLVLEQWRGTRWIVEVLSIAGLQVALQSFLEE